MIIYRAPVPPFPTFSAQQLFQLISVANFTALKMRFLDVGEYSTTIRRAEKGLDPAKGLYSTLGSG
jgi:dihydrodipicolinate synthase/N-acetylneuraminate lyase